MQLFIRRCSPVATAHSKGYYNDISLLYMGSREGWLVNNKSKLHYNHHQYNHSVHMQCSKYMIVFIYTNTSSKSCWREHCTIDLWNIWVK